MGGKNPSAYKIKTSHAWETCAADDREELFSCFLALGAMTLFIASTLTGITTARDKDSLATTLDRGEASKVLSAASLNKSKYQSPIWIFKHNYRDKELFIVNTLILGIQIWEKIIKVKVIQNYNWTKNYIFNYVCGLGCNIRVASCSACLLLTAILEM